jgi:hypothetical protein
MLIRRSPLMLPPLLFLLFPFFSVHVSPAAECFTPPPSVQQGRGVFEDLVPTDLSADEYKAVKDLLNSLKGKWTGTAELISCEGTEDEPREEIENYSVEANGSMDSSGKFALVTKFSSRQKRKSYEEKLRLYLDHNKLASEPNRSVSDIELLSVSSDELIYVTKIRGRRDGGAVKVQETITGIHKTNQTVFLVDQLLYLQGRLTSKSTWRLDRK